jgi:coenzyme Q-binding protein COQ10
MTTIDRRMRLPYRSDDLFDLVSDVRRYPGFVRWIRALRVISETQADGGRELRAEAEVGFAGFSERFTTDVAVRPAEGRVDVRLVRGPFRHLASQWVIVPCEGGSELSFSVRFEFRSFILQALAEANRDFAVARLTDCFVEEARRRYAPVLEQSGPGDSLTA